MSGDNRRDAYDFLLDLAAQYGYVTFDNILSAVERWQLPLTEVDKLSNSILEQGVLVYDEKPEKVNRVNEENDSEYDDYAQSDYEYVFNKIIELEPGLEQFINDVRGIKPPQYREFAGLIYQAKEGNRHARTRIIEMHLRIALRIALQRAEQYDADLIDCVGEACNGLIIAFEKYDPDTSGAFGSYASMWIFQNISREQKTQRPDVYYPVHKKEQYFTIYPIMKKKGCTTCNYVLQCQKVRRLIQERLECSETQLEDVLLQAVPFYSFEQMVEESHFDVFNVFEKHDFGIRRRFFEELIFYDNVQEALEEEERRLLVNEVLNTLTPREKAVIQRRYGFDDGVEKTLEVIGSDLEVTRERIRQIEAKALKKLCHPSCRKKLRECF